MLDREWRFHTYKNCSIYCYKSKQGPLLVIIVQTVHKSVEVVKENGEDCEVTKNFGECEGYIQYVYYQIFIWILLLMYLHLHLFNTQNKCWNYQMFVNKIQWSLFRLTFLQFDHQQDSQKNIGWRSNVDFVCLHFVLSLWVYLSFFS